MWWRDDLVNLLILLFDFITKPYWLDTWYLHPIMLCDPMLNYVTSFGPAVSYWFYFILVYLVVNVWPVTASVDCISRPETAHVAYLILFFSKFCVQSYRFHLWCLPQVIPSFYIIYINFYISDYVPCDSGPYRCTALPWTYWYGFGFIYQQSFLTNICSCHWTL